MRRDSSRRIRRLKEPAMSEKATTPEVPEASATPPPTETTMDVANVKPVIPKPGMKLFFDMLSYKRPHSSPTEKEFNEHFLDSIPGMESDDFGNRFLIIGQNPTTVFTAHVDTVHAKDGRQQIVYDKTMQTVYKDDGQCLGADNAAGIFCLLHLIHAGIPGLYLFCRGEERGRLGSKWIADKKPEILKDIQRAIAFDRRDTCSIITKQCGRTCCSPEFSAALATALQPLKLRDDPTGAYTDTASFMGMIPECTNISVGYDHEHTKDEIQDLEHLKALTQAIVNVNWETLPTKRDPKATPAYSNMWGNHTSPVYNQNSRYKPDANRSNLHPAIRTLKANLGVTTFTDTKASWATVYDFVGEYPDAAADLLFDLGISMADLLAYGANSIHCKLN